LQKFFPKLQHFFLSQPAYAFAKGVAKSRSQGENHERSEWAETLTRDGRSQILRSTQVGWEDWKKRGRQAPLQCYWVPLQPPRGTCWN